jgi:hypothetical protein
LPKLRAEPADFVLWAPWRHTFVAEVPADQERVFAAISADPSTWVAWFPGLTAGGYEGDGQAGLGTRRWVKVGGTTYRETMVAWDAPSRWTYRVDEASVPLGKALVEEWLIEDTGPGRSTVKWTFAIDPRLAFRLGQPFAVRIIGRVFHKGMRNLGERLRASAS